MKNINKDAYLRIEVNVNFEGDNLYNIIKLNNKTSYYINVFLYVLFTLLTIVEFYKIFIKIVTLEQEITIVKFISSRTDLSNIQKYNPFNP